MKRLGGEVVNIHLDNTTSIAKGETIEDTIRTIGEYVDAIVMRHSQKGMVAHCAEISPVPIINAGDGDGEHPTQALLDLYTIKQEVGRTSNLNIMMVGDLKYSRTVHSLIHLLSLYKSNKFIFTSLEDMQVPEEYLPEEDTYTVTKWMTKNLKNIDVLYMTRIQKERWVNKKDFDESFYVLNSEALDAKTKVLHPLPRGKEIPISFDSDPRAAYFRQVKNGMFVRMAILDNYLLN
jgi:aspartate carbamoyltransferase